MLMTSEAAARRKPLSRDELESIDLWWRTANYLSVGQIYLLANPLLREPLLPEHVKPRLLGHWGTTPGRAVRIDGEIPMATSGRYRWRPAGSLGWRRLRLEHDPRGDSARLDVGDRFVYLVERSGFADHAGLAGSVQFEHLA